MASLLPTCRLDSHRLHSQPSPFFLSDLLTTCVFLLVFSVGKIWSSVKQHPHDFNIRSLGSEAPNPRAEVLLVLGGAGLGPRSLRITGNDCFLHFQPHFPVVCSILSDFLHLCIGRRRDVYVISIPATPRDWRIVLNLKSKFSLSLHLSSSLIF